MTQPCAYKMKYRADAVENRDPDVVSWGTGKQCSIKDVTKEFARGGVDVVDTTTSSTGDLFLLIGVKTNAVQALIRASVAEAKRQ